MSEAKFGEPLMIVHHVGYSELCDRDRKMIAQGFRSDEQKLLRICACVNACASLPDPTSLRTQRDGLLAAAKALVDLFTSPTDGPLNFYDEISVDHIPQLKTAIAACGE